MPWKSPSILCHGSILLLSVIAPSRLLTGTCSQWTELILQGIDQLWLSFRYFYKLSVLSYYKPIWWFEFYILFSFCCSISTSLLEKFLLQREFINGSPDSEPCLVSRLKSVWHAGALLWGSRANISRWRWQHVLKKDQLEFSPKRNNSLILRNVNMIHCFNKLISILCWSE